MDNKKYTLINKCCNIKCFSCFTGSISDGGVWSETELGKCMVQGTLDIPPPCELPDTNIKTNHVLVAYEAFPLNINLMKPYSQKFLASVH